MRTHMREGCQSFLVLSDSNTVQYVNPAYTSQTCHVCGQRGNRIERDTFICTNPECTCYNQAQDADMNAAINIAKSKDVIK